MGTFRNVVLNDGRILMISASIVRANKEKTNGMEEDKQVNKNLILITFVGKT